MAKFRLATRLKIDSEDLNKIIQKQNLHIVKEKFDNNKIDHILNLYEDGISAKALGFKYSIDKRRIMRWAKERGIFRDKKEAGRTIYFDEHLMDEIITPAKAYWLGFCYADAYNSDEALRLTLAIKDIDHVRKFAKFFGLGEDRVFYDEKSACLHLHSKYLCETMTKHGCPRAKSFIIKYPEWLDESLTVHFIRGTFDGDGCLTFRKRNREWKWDIAGTHHFCNGVRDVLLKEVGINTYIYCISKTNKNTYVVSTSGNEKIATICDWMYQDAHDEIMLTRKYEKYLQLKEQQRNRKIGRDKYNIPVKAKRDILTRLKNGEDQQQIAEDHGIHQVSVKKMATYVNNFINTYSAPCLLGKMAKNPTWHGNIFSWTVSNKNHAVVANDHILTNTDIEYLKQIRPFSFHYMFKPNIDILSQHFEISKTKIKSILLNVSEIDVTGNKGKTFRNYINRYSGYDIKEELGNIGDAKDMIDRWSETMGEKYFRDFSGKNLYFFQNNYHQDCECIFVYDKDKLISFGVASPGAKSVYVIGKALAQEYPGLSEFTDIKLYEKLLKKYGAFQINLGMATKGLMAYKSKFPGSIEQGSYNGKVIV